MQSADIRLVVGTRPEAIKLAPVARALAARGFAPALILTGQHASLDPADFGLDRYPAERFSCAGEANPHSHVRKVTAAMLQLLHHAPDLLIVQGDTSSALGAAEAGFRTGVPVAHVEAGLRTHDPLSPWPEEQYRTAIDAGAELLFAPTEISAANLAREQVGGEVHVTGNTGIDALLGLVGTLPAPPPREDAAAHILVTCHRRESWGAGLRSIASALAGIAAEEPVRIDFVLHPNAHVAAMMTDLLRPIGGIELVDPCTHAGLVQRMRGADLILSDSGGIQEEAPALGVPLLVLRDKTERPEGTAAGNMRLVGTGTDRIVSATLELLRDEAARVAMSHPALPYGDGHSGKRIAGIIETWLRGRTIRRRRTA